MSADGEDGIDVHSDSIIDVLVKQPMGVEDLGVIPHKPFFEAFCKDYAASLDSMTPIACANVTLSAMDQALLVRMLPFAQNLLAEVSLLVDAVSGDEGQHYDAALQTNLRGYCEMLVFLISYANAHRPPDSSSLQPSPIGRMPREIIIEFLLHALDYYAPKGPMGISLDTSTSTWKYTQICRIWREVAVSLPQLWSHLRFDYATKSPMSMRSPRALMTILLERSKNRPLSIIYDDKHVAMSSPAMTLILEESWRWQHVHFILRSSQSLERLGAVEGLLGNLESVHLCTPIKRHSFRPGTDRIGGELATFAFLVAPKLRSVILALSDLDTYRDVYISLPWKQLTRFEELDVASGLIFTNLPNSKLPLLKSNYRLTECVLVHSKWPNSPARFPHLRVLDVQDETTLSSLTLPALETLTIETLAVSRSTLLNSMITRSQFPLQSLTILDACTDMGTIHDRSLTVTLRLIPSLVGLRLARTFHHEDVLDSLAQEHAFLPNLERFTMNVDITADIFRHLDVSEVAGPAKMQDIEQSVLRMVESRMTSACGTKCLNFFRFGIGFHFLPHLEFSRSFLSRVDELKDLGMDIACEVLKSRPTNVKRISLGAVYYKEALDWKLT